MQLLLVVQLTDYVTIGQIYVTHKLYRLLYNPVTGYLSLTLVLLISLAHTDNQCNVLESMVPHGVPTPTLFMHLYGFFLL